MQLDPLASPSPVGCPARHLVHFYEDGAFPDVFVADFLWEGLEAGDSLVVIANPEHARAMRERLALRCVGVEDLERSGRLAVFDAGTTLRNFMVEAGPDAARFVAVVGAAIDAAAAAAPSGRVRAYGDMVVLLAEGGNIGPSIALERCWNDLLASRACELCCAYPLRLFGQTELAESFSRVCDAHNEIIPIQTGLGGDDGHERCIAVLQQQAYALRVETAERRRTEACLRTLAQLSQVLTTSIDYETMLASVIELSLPALGDLGFLDVIEARGEARRLARAHQDPETEALISGSSFGGPGRFNLSSLVTGRAALHPLIDGAWLQSAAEGADELALMHQLGLCSMITVPLEHKGRTLGSLTLFHGRSGRHHDAIDLDLAREIAHRAAAGIEHAKLYQERSEALRKQEEANRQKDEFLAMLGHELRNPLEPIMMAVDVMDLRGDPESEQERRVIRRQTEHLKRLVDDLLSVSRVMHGKIDLQKQPVEISTVVTQALEVVHVMLEQEGHTLSVQVPATGLMVLGDPFRLSQIFTNLLTNAAKYSDPGARIGLAARSDGHEVVVEVSDTGWGMSPEVLATVFEPFVQGERKLDRALGGLGLGLGLVRSLAALHGGSVVARSEGPGQGSTFTVRLPVLKSVNGDVQVNGDVHMNADAAPVARPGRAGGLRVLVVDDNHDVVDMLAEAFRGRGFDVRSAYESADALRLAAESPLDVALIDIGLPIMDGYELAKRLRATPEGRKLRLVALTGYGQGRYRELSQKAGFDVHLVKPVDFDTILEAVAVEPAS